MSIQTASGSNNTAAIRVKLLSPERTGFGLMVGKRSNTPPCLFVKYLEPLGPAAASGLLVSGDIILQINGVDISVASYEEAMKMFESSILEPELNLLIRAPLGYSTHLETTFNEEGCPRTYRITERLYSVSKETSSARDPALTSVNLNLEDGKDVPDVKRR